MALEKGLLNGFLKKGDKVIVGVSGGADSMCLLSLVNDFSKDVDIEVLAVHINHNLRDAEAKRDEMFVCNFCKQLGIKVKNIHINVVSYAEKESKTIEQAARELRYDAFNKLLKEQKANKILVAHHKSDQAETVLMHIARGSSIKGASGMKDFSGEIVRPLLNFSKDEILKYCDENNIEYIEDSSNSDVKYSRNYIRHDIMPKLKKLYPSIESNLCDFARLCLRDDDFIESQLPLELLQEEKNKVVLDEKIYSLHSALSTRLVKKAFEKLNAFADMEEKHILQVLELFTYKNGAEISLPNKIYAYKEYDKVVLIKGKRQTKNKEQKFILGETKIKGYGSIYALDITGKQDPEFGDGNHYLDMHKIPFSAIWRTKKDGDIFAKLGSGSKKLADYFTDKKIPKRLRETIPVLAVGNKILVVAGYDIADGVKITSKTEQIIKVIYQTNL